MTEDPSASSIPDCDLQICVDAALGQKILAAVNFPLQVDLPASSFSDSDLEPYLDEDEAGDGKPTAREDAAIQDSGKDELEEVIEDVVAYALAEGQRDEQDSSQLKTPVDKKRTRVELTALSLIVPTAPTLTLSNPIVLSDLTVKIHAEIKACVRVFGKWRCVNASTPWMTLSGREATLQLSSAGAVVFATPVVEDIDMVVALKIFKWRLKCKLGITKIVNRELAKRGPIQLVDLSGLAQGMLFQGKQPCIEAITFASGKNGLVIRSCVAVG